MRRGSSVFFFLFPMLPFWKYGVFEASFLVSLVIIGRLAIFNQASQKNEKDHLLILRICSGNFKGCKYACLHHWLKGDSSNFTYIFINVPVLTTKNLTKRLVVLYIKTCWIPIFFFFHNLVSPFLIEVLSFALWNFLKWVSTLRGQKYS